MEEKEHIEPSTDQTSDVQQESTTRSPETPKAKSRRGFGAMSAEKQRKIASLGGKAAHAKGTAHEFSREEAREAGRKGGLKSHAKHVGAHPQTKP
jgi:uncharacterized protein